MPTYPDLCVGGSLMSAPKEELNNKKHVTFHLTISRKLFKYLHKKRHMQVYMGRYDKTSGNNTGLGKACVCK